MSSLLAACGHKYSVQSIIQSELRVLKTLNYRLMICTPLVYVETLLAVLGLTLYCTVILRIGVADRGGWHVPPPPPPPPKKKSGIMM